MSRPASIFVCQSCGAQTRQFFGRCSSCGSWNSLVEQTAPKHDGRRRRAPAESAAVPAARRSTAMADLGDRPIQRLESGYPDLVRVLGGGVVPGSLVLVGGGPGIGQSTLLWQ
ncbi:MAG: DNA repair protein RadA, partial [Synechococcus sp.]|nr:DNA repair protein RadA [Synechococcus sp.]